MAFTNSPLTTYTRISPNRTVNRNHAIDRITPHCVVGQLSAPAMANLSMFTIYDEINGASCNYGIGRDGDVALVVEEKDRSWCSSSKENDHRAVTIECASDTKHPYSITDAVWNTLIKLCTDICRRNGKDRLIWFGDKNKTLAYNPKPNEMILTVHRWFANKACPGDFIYARLGLLADTVTKALGGSAEPVADKYVVRLSYKQPETQTNSYNNLDYAKAEADRHPGYSVYVAETGECVYTSLQELGYTPDEWIAMIMPICVELATKYHILPSVVFAQTALETGWGTTDLTRRFNVLGMKADLINNTWKDHSVWDGEVYRKVTPEYHNGQLIYVEDNFRVYKTFRECIDDYENFLLYVRNDKGYKYRRLHGKTDPAEVINIIRVGTGTNKNPEGYCTDPNYESKILKIIKDYNLTQYDSVMTETKDIYAVQRSRDETQFRLGLYHVLNNAMAQADEHWGYKVFNIETGACVYEPKLTLLQKLIAKCLQFNDFVIWDNKNGRQWRYYNNKRSAPTFWETRDKKLYITNCMGGVSFACKDAGIPSSALQWYGIPGGIRWLTGNAKKDAEKYFNIIEVKGKTVSKCIKDGTILPGDIITYMGMAHTNMYLGNGTSYDAGHAYCKGSGEGAEYTKWVGETAHPNSKVACVLRLADKTNTKYIYRVQLGAYTEEKYAKRRVTTVKNKSGFDSFIEHTDCYRVFCGSFENKANAEKRVADLAAHGIKDAIIKAVKVV